ncbi:MAG: hypothetical protein LBL46_04025 [Rickettsiales bacterium]|jgi:hypothetical protein|nr:hypothetical protein [Rickettsiales bacterium]
MPLKKKNKFRNKVVFWIAMAALLALAFYVPKHPNAGRSGEIEYELY